MYFSLSIFSSFVSELFFGEVSETLASAVSDDS